MELYSPNDDREWEMEMDGDGDNDCREMVRAFFNPADRWERMEDCADDPILLTERELSMEGLNDSRNNERLMNN